MRRVKILVDRRKEGNLPSFRDDKGERIEPACKFARERFNSLVSSRKRAPTVNVHMQQVEGGLGEFLEYLLTLRRRDESIWDLLRLVDDQVLIDFREWAYARTRAKSSSRGELEAKATTNIKLRIVYDWIYWCMKAGQLPEDTMGRIDCKIQSSLPDLMRSPQKHLRHWREKYPKSFPYAGAGSKAGLPQFWATQDQIDAVINIFLQQEDILAGERNVLLALIGNDVAWRRSSVQSLAPADFSEERMRASRDAGDPLFPVKPRVQKNGKAITFYINWPLAERIHQYIVGYVAPDGEERGRPAILKALGKRSNHAPDHIFLSTTTGNPLQVTALTEIFSDAFRSIGAPKGSSYHGLRRGAAEFFMRTEIQFRLKKGLSTAKEDIMDAVSERLGHSTRATSAIYVRVLTSLVNGSVEVELRTENCMLQVQLLDTAMRARWLESENARLHAELGRAKRRRRS